VSTAIVFTVNDAVVAPAAMASFAGTVVLGSLDVMSTTAPPTGAGGESTKVAVDAFPPSTAEGFKVRLAIPAEGVIVRVADLEVLPREADITAEPLTVLDVVETENLTEDCPLGTRTEVGTEASVLLLARASTTPPFGATPLSPTTLEELFPLTTVAGLRLIETKVAGVIVRVADWEALPLPAVIVTSVGI